MLQQHERITIPSNSPFLTNSFDWSRLFSPLPLVFPGDRSVLKSSHILRSSCAWRPSAQGRRSPASLSPYSHALLRLQRRVRNHLGARMGESDGRGFPATWRTAAMGAQEERRIWLLLRHFRSPGTSAAAKRPRPIEGIRQERGIRWIVNPLCC